MPESTAHPDCVHCRFMQGHKHGGYRCRQHDMILHTPVTLFCKMHNPVEQDGGGEETIDLESLDANALYIWIEKPGQDEGEAQIEVGVVATLIDYQAWSAGMFWQRIRELRGVKRSDDKTRR